MASKRTTEPNRADALPHGEITAQVTPVGRGRVQGRPGAPPARAEASVPNRDTLAYLLDVRRRIILTKPGLVTDSVAALRRLRDGEEIAPDPDASEPPRSDD